MEMHSCSSNPLHCGQILEEGANFTFTLPYGQQLFKSDDLLLILNAQWTTVSESQAMYYRVTHQHKCYLYFVTIDINMMTYQFILFH